MTEETKQVAEQIQAAEEVVAPPIVVTPSTIPVMLAATGRIMAILVAGVAVLVKLLSAKDLMGAWLWMQSTEGAAFLATVGLATSWGSSLYLTWKKHKKMIVFAANADDSVGYVKGQEGSPKG